MIIVGHLADIHLRNTQRFEEYKAVFYKLFDSLVEHRVDVIFVLGDVFHSKTKLSPESVELGHFLFSNLASCTEGPVIVIPGNHDLSLKNPNRLDSIYPIIKSVKKSLQNDNIVYSKKSENINVAIKNQNISIAHYCLTDQDNWDRLEKSNIALFHGQIDNCKTDTGFVMENTGIGVDMFRDHDIVMLGDIHKYQTLSYNTVYCGSLLNQDFSEDLNKGWVKWNIDENNWDNFTFEQIIIPNDCGHYTLVVRQDGSFPLASEIPPHPVLRVYCQNPNLTPSEIKEIEQRIIQRFCPTEIRSIQTLDSKVKIESFNNIQVNIDIENVYETSVQANYIRQYYKDKITDEEIEELISLNNLYQTSLPPSENIRNLKWSVNEIRFSNFGKYGKNNTIKFNKLRGITGIVGRNRVGKSTAFYSLMYALYKETLHPSLNIEDIINRGNGSMKIDLDINVGSENYIVERRVDVYSQKDQKTKLYRDVLSPDINFYKIVDGNKISLNGDTKWETEANIRAIFGSVEDFKLTSYSQQNQGLELIDDKRGKERKEILSRFLGIDVFSKLKSINKEELDLVDLQLKGMNIQELIQKKNLRSKELGELVSKLNITDHKIERLKTEKISAEEELQILHNQFQPIDNELLEKDEFTIQNEINDCDQKILDGTDRILKLTSERSSLEKTLEKAKQANAMFATLEPVMEELKIEEKKLSELIKQKEILESNIISLNRAVLILSKQPWCRERKCLFLQDALKSEDELKIKEIELGTIERNIDSKQEFLNSKESQKKKYDSLIKLQIEIQNVKDQYVEIQQSINEEEKKKKTLEISKSNSIFLLDKISQNKERIEYNKQIKKQIADIELSLRIVNNDIDKIYHVYTAEFAQKRQKEYEKENIDNDIETYKNNEQRFRILKLYKEAVDVDGIPLSIVKNILPLLNVEINKLLFNSDFNLSLETNPEGTEILTYIIDSDSKRRIESGSGMEKLISSFALRAALVSLSSLPKPNFLVIDEGFGTLDSDNLANVGKLFEQLKLKFEHIIIISHIDSILDFCDSEIEIDIDEKGNSFIKEIR